MPDPTLLPVAAIVSDHQGHIDALLRDFAHDQRAAGRRIRGLIQSACGQGDGPCDYRLTDLDEGTVYPISQALGRESSSCRIDPGAMAEASAVMRRIAAEGADLAVFNRFAKLESLGRGFSAEMLDLMSRGIPVLTVVPRDHLPAWRAFTGGEASELPPERAALDAWLDRALAAR